MKKLNKWEKTFKELGVDLSSYKPTATQELPKYHSCREVLNSPAYKKWAKDMEKYLEDLYMITIWDYLPIYYKKMLAKPIKLTPSRKKGK